MKKYMKSLIAILSLAFILTFFIDVISVLKETEEVIEMKKRHTQPFAAQSTKPYLPNVKVNLELEKYNKQFSLEDDKYKL